MFFWTDSPYHVMIIPVIPKRKMPNGNQSERFITINFSCIIAQLMVVYSLLVCRKETKEVS